MRRMFVEKILCKYFKLSKWENKPEIARMNLTDVVRIIKAINLALLRNSKIKRQIIIYFLGGRKIQCKSLAK